MKKKIAIKHTSRISKLLTEMKMRSHWIAEVNVKITDQYETTNSNFRLIIETKEKQEYLNSKSGMVVYPAISKFHTGKKSERETVSSWTATTICKGLGKYKPEATSYRERQRLSAKKETKYLKVREREREKGTLTAVKRRWRLGLSPTWWLFIPFLPYILEPNVTFQHYLPFLWLKNKRAKKKTIWNLLYW